MASEPNIYDIGDKARLVATFTDDTGAPIDPGNPIVFKIRTPDGTVVARTYLVDPVIRESAGVYHYDYDLRLGAAGTYPYRAESVDPGQAAAENSFRVRLSAFYP